MSGDDQMDHPPGNRNWALNGCVPSNHSAEIATLRARVEELEEKVHGSVSQGIPARSGLALTTPSVPREPGTHYGRGIGEACQEARQKPASAGALAGVPVPGTPGASEVRGPLRVIDIVFDGSPGPEGPRFIETEDGRGRSINAGIWLQRPDGYWVLRIIPALYVGR